MSDRVVWKRQAGETIVVGVVDETAAADNVGNITAKCAALPAGRWTLDGTATPVAFTSVAYRAAVGTEGADGYVAKGYDFTLAAATSASLAAGMHLFDYTDTTGGDEFTSDPFYLQIRKAASQ